YVLVFAALLLTMGSIGDRIGRKRMLQFGLLIFGVCSMWAALSISTSMLVIARAFLGIGAAIIMPATLSLVTASFPDPKERAQAIAIWAGVFGFGLGLGPVIAGWLLEHYAWNSVFIVNIPIVGIGLVGSYFFIEESMDRNAPRPDIPGVILSTAGLFALVYGIIKAGDENWTDATVFISLAIGAVLLLGFAYWEKHAATPMLPPAYFKNMSFTGANIALMLVTLSLFGSYFFMSQFFQSVQGYTPLETGLLIVPMAVVLMVFTVNSARVARRIGNKLTVSLGILTAGCGLFYLALVPDVDSDYWVVLIGLCVLTAGMGTATSPATNSIMGSVPVNRAGIASAMNDISRQVGGALGIAVLGTIMNTTYLSKIDELSIQIAALPQEAFEVIRGSVHGAHIVADSISDQAIAKTIVDASNDAFVSGITDAFLVGGIIMVLTAILTVIILPTQVMLPSEE
ncbi:MAG: MFS transporter, partial [Chloroflexota bacterium]|nr:MFS transporter [Chloroflexota bacterium]